MRASRKSLFKGFGACGPPANHFLKVLVLAGLPQIIFKSFWCLRGSRKSLFKGFDACGAPANRFLKVWHFRAWRKSFPERFGISALGESHFPKGLAFPRLAKVVSRMVWHFRARRKSFPERFGISAHGESRFPNGLVLTGLPQISFKRF